MHCVWLYETFTLNSQALRVCKTLCVLVNIGYYRDQNVSIYVVKHTYVL